MADHKQFLIGAYKALNSGKIDAILAVMHAEVDWPNALGRGRIQGHQAFRTYWTAQLGRIQMLVEPQRFMVEDDLMVVEARQTVTDPSGVVLANRLVQHAFAFKDGLIKRMDIRPM